MASTPHSPDHELKVTGFTRGPWSKSGWGAMESSGKTIAKAYGPLEQREANAHLIAAAPELYEALEKAAMFVGWASTRGQIVAGVDAGELGTVIDAILAKARGEQQ
jgi:hypothetical protein